MQCSTLLIAYPLISRELQSERFQSRQKLFYQSSCHSNRTLRLLHNTSLMRELSISLRTLRNFWRRTISSAFAQLKFLGVSGQNIGIMEQSQYSNICQFEYNHSLYTIHGEILCIPIDRLSN